MRRKGTLTWALMPGILAIGLVAGTTGIALAQKQILNGKQEFFTSLGWVALYVDREGIAIGDVRIPQSQQLVASRGNCFPGLNVPKPRAGSLPSSVHGFTASGYILADLSQRPVIDSRVNAELSKIKRVSLTFSEISVQEVSVFDLERSLSKMCRNRYVNKDFNYINSLLRAKVKYEILDDWAGGTDAKISFFKQLIRKSSLGGKVDVSVSDKGELIETVTLPQAYQFAVLKKGPDGRNELEPVDISGLAAKAAAAREYLFPASINEAMLASTKDPWGWTASERQGFVTMVPRPEDRM